MARRGLIATLAGLPPGVVFAMQQDKPKSGLRTVSDAKHIRHLRQNLLWPVHLLPLQEEASLQHHWEHLAKPSTQSPWREVDDEFGDPAEFQERHYNEFVTFLPPGTALPVRAGPRPGGQAQLRGEPN